MQSLKKLIVLFGWLVGVPWLYLVLSNCLESATRLRSQIPLARVKEWSRESFWDSDPEERAPWHASGNSEKCKGFQQSKSQRRENLVPTSKCQSLVSTSRAEVLVHMGNPSIAKSMKLFPSKRRGQRGRREWCHLIVQRSATLLSFWKTAVPSLVLAIFFWHQTISKILLLYCEGWNETLVNSVQTFPMKDKTSDKSIGLQARRQALMEMCFITWEGCIIAICLLLGCWESDTVLPLRCEDHSVNVYEAHRLV